MLRVVWFRSVLLFWRRNRLKVLMDGWIDGVMCFFLISPEKISYCPNVLAITLLNVMQKSACSVFNPVTVNKSFRHSSFIWLHDEPDIKHYFSWFRLDLVSYSLLESTGSTTGFLLFLYCCGVV